jgi:Ubiquitin carboxyl-terminal hydrolase
MQNMGTLERALDAYFRAELMEDDNAYKCEELGKHVPAIKRTLIERLPHTFVISLKRFEFNFVNMTRYKISERFEFPAKLDMFKYTTHGHAAATRGAAAAAGAVVPENPTSVAATPTPGATPANYYVYELKGVVVHTGNAFAGHYYSFVKERGPSGGSWQCFDDTTVTSWDPSNMDECCFGGPAGPEGPLRPNTAYMLVYERKDEFEPINICPHLQPAASPAAAGVPPPTLPPRRETASHPLSDARVSSGEGSAAGSPTAAEAAADSPTQPEAAQQQQPGGPTVPYGMPMGLFARIMQENLWLAQARHLTAPCHTAFLKALLVECLQLSGATDCHDVRHTMALHGKGSLSNKTLSCDARTATALKRLAVATDGIPSPASRLPEPSEAEGSREALAALLALKHTLATLVFVPVDEAQLAFFLDAIESGLERRLAVERSLALLLESVRWQGADSASPLNGLLHLDGRVRECMGHVVAKVLSRACASFEDAGAAVRALQASEPDHALVRSVVSHGLSVTVTRLSSGRLSHIARML